MALESMGTCLVQCGQMGISNYVGLVKPECIRQPDKPRSGVCIMPRYLIRPVQDEENVTPSITWVMFFWGIFSAGRRELLQAMLRHVSRTIKST